MIQSGCRIYKFLCFTGLFLLLSCSAEKSADVSTQKPSDDGKGIAAPQEQAVPGSAAYSIEIAPVEATRHSMLNVSSKGFNLQDARIIWLLNGSPVSVVAPEQFNAADAQKGDTIQAKAQIQDSEIFSNTVKIKNAAPELTKVKLMPEVFSTGVKLYIEASATDIDEDDVLISYEWTKNRESAGDTKEIGAQIKRGDKIIVKINSFDGETYGKAITLHREIGNMSPMIAEDNKFNFNGKVFTHQVIAEDPDKDELTFSLKSAKDDMTIDPKTGLITWNVPKDFTGNAPVTVSVADGHGGESTRQLTFSINPAAVKEKDSSKESQQGGNSPLEKGE